MKLDVISLDGKKGGSIDLDDEIFGLDPRADILQRMVRYQLAKRQAGTHKTKTRAEISRTGAKMFRQKGTGRARHGSARVGVFRGGGRAFGPVVRSHAHDLPKKVRALALKHALSTKAKASDLIILENTEMKDAKTKALLGTLGNLGFSSALVIDGADVNGNFQMAARNLKHLDVLPVQGINVYDILRREKLVLTRAAVDALKERFK
ncbi:50S ribosomal protein L4 [Tepidamorphus sp. 3E244]|uniref:50S ribosomal protein L4 n=1 Tax=Tepidamorphus sp. 3E244 TaxID=3385498 RepID=UPI0038FC10DE